MKIKVVTMHICQPCLDGIGDECHTPECVMWLHQVDLPFDPRAYEVQREYETAPALSNRSIKERVIAAFNSRCEFAPNGCDCEDHCKGTSPLSNAERIDPHNQS